MKKLKILGLVVMAAASLTAFCSTASASPVITSPAGTEYTGSIHMTLESGASMVLRAAIDVTCTASTAAGTVTTNNTTHAQITLSTLTFSNCTKHTSVVSPGSMTINDVGEIFVSGLRVQFTDTSLGITCFYGAEAGSVKVGTLSTGTPAKVAINTTALPRLSGSSTFFCPEKATWTMSYVVTSPSSFFIT